MPNFDLNEFTWFVPREKKTLYITIPNAESINLNKLATMMPERIDIGIKGANIICIRQDDAGYKVTKRGSLKARDIISSLVNNGLSIPAKYAVVPDDPYWYAELESKTSPIVICPSKTLKNPRKKGLGKLIDKEESV